MSDYYCNQLAAQQLKDCYDIAPRRVRQYLQAEIDHVKARLQPGALVLELGCGYGRVLADLAPNSGSLIGIDTSRSSLQLGRKLLREYENCRLLRMNAAKLGFCDQIFDFVLCIQNGISAFKVDQHILMAQAVRITRPGGRVLFSSYSEKFWDARLEWFQKQADHGLLGEIDQQTTGNGVIVCKDGFRATTIGPTEFEKITTELGVHSRLEEVDESSLFCEITV